jgi:F-type H+-transporting ATPase subunit gamma
MPSLKDLRNRIGSVRSTRKITQAMKMVAASKLRRAQEQAQAGQPYSERMAAMLSRVAANAAGGAGGPRLLAGTGKDDVHLLVVITSDRGLAGGFNASVAREARREIARLTQAGKTVKLMTVGRKGRDTLRRDHGSRLGQTFEGIGRQRLSFTDASRITQIILEMYERGEFDVCTVIYNRFKSVVSQIPTVQQVIPFALPEPAAGTDGAAAAGPRALYEFEPNEEQILEQLLPRNLSVQVFRALLDSAAGEQAARMQAMDNATRNAGEMIAKLTLNYNRARQAQITKELIEIISGAEAV